MARALVDLTAIDLEGSALTEEELRSTVPHAHEFRMVDTICHLDFDAGIIVGFKDWDADPWWARGHIPGRPLMPGVLLVEGGAQVATVLMKRMSGWDADRFIGLGGLDKVRFRGQVEPPARVYYASKVGVTSGTRIARYPAQAFCNGKLILTMELLGLPL